MLGAEFGLGAREMNLLFKKYGYLYGEPGAYGLTEKGMKYAQEHYHDNGYGGYAARSWETRTWSDDVVAALRADMSAYPEGLPIPVVEPQTSDHDEVPLYTSYVTSNTGARPRLDGNGALVSGGVLFGAYLARRYGPQLWKNVIKPSAARLRARFSGKRGPDDRRGD